MHSFSQGKSSIFLTRTDSLGVFTVYSCQCLLVSGDSGRDRKGGANCGRRSAGDNRQGQEMRSRKEVHWLPGIAAYPR